MNFEPEDAKSDAGWVEDMAAFVFAALLMSIIALAGFGIWRFLK